MSGDGLEVPSSEWSTGRCAAAPTEGFSHFHQDKATENGGKECISALHVQSFTLSALASDWAVTKSQDLDDPFHVKIPPQKLSVQRGEPILLH